ncbi:MAG: IS110 family transposase [Acidobacteria bacterium]|nr:IS110 family transposase [Acidobacteriota bacterium]
MLAELVDHVIGVDPDRDRITAVIIDAATKGVVDQIEAPATPTGYRAVVKWADSWSVAESRVWSIEGAGSYGAGLCATLQDGGEWVVEFDHPGGRSDKDGAKSDGLDAARAARELLGRSHYSTPRSRGQREALRALTVTRRGAQHARVSAINELKALIVTAPVKLREELRGLTLTSLIGRCSRLRPGGGSDVELAGTKQAMRLLARRVSYLTDEVNTIDAELERIVTDMAPQLLDEFGVGPVSAAQIIISWSHPGRCRNEAAFARLAGTAPLPANSGQTQDRHRLSRGGDRHLNRALHTIVLTRARSHPDTRAYIDRKTSQGKTSREARRCLKRYLARHLYRLLENPPQHP